MTGDWPSIPALVRSAAATHAGREAVIDGDGSLSYPELFEQAQRFAGAVVSCGLAPGERVGIWTYNSVEWIVAALGLWQAGCVLVPVNTRFKGGEAADILGRSGVRLLVTVTDFLGTDYVGLLGDAQLPVLDTIVVAAGNVPQGAESWASFMARGKTEAQSEAGRRAAALGLEDPSDILFTSGTTGRPKGVVQTHGRTLRVGTDWVAMTGLQPGDRYLMVNPYFHMFGLKAGILASIAAGATMLPQAVFDLDAVLTRVEGEKVTVLPGAPTLYQSILDHPGRADYDLSTLRVAVTGAADIPVELIRRVREELPFSLVVTGYGLTEAGTATATSPEDDATLVATTVGRPRPGFELRIADDKGTDVVPGVAGEILLRGGSVMSHYLDDAEATEAALSVDGWLRTGDLGTVDDRGFLRVVGRSKEMFIVGGFNVYPAEVENLLLEHPGVARAAVIGIPDRRLGEVGMAFVVPRPGASVDTPDMVEWARSRMANYKVPRFIEVVDELPLNATGKVEKDVLRRRQSAASRRAAP